MRIRSQWIFESEPRHIWPNFLLARMDDSRPLLFRLGIPKPASRKVLEDGHKKVERLTEFRATTRMWRLLQIGLRVAPAPTHHYAACIWRRLNEVRKNTEILERGRAA